MNTRILLADDHNLFREGLRAMLDKKPGIEVVGEAKDGLSAVRLARELVPDVILMDISMEDLNGIEAARRILVDHPDIRIIMLSMHSDQRFVIESLKAGALGYLLKDSAFDELLDSISTVMKKQVYLSVKITNIVINDYINIRRQEKSSVFSVLSTREREVLQLVAEGRSTKEIAAQLSVSVKTVETHRKQIMDKLGLHSVAELTKYAIREGLTELN